MDINAGCLRGDDDAQILKVLQTEYRWLTFDELYSKVRPDCDWTSFAGVLEELVKQGQVEYTLPYGAETGYYKIPSR